MSQQTYPATDIKVFAVLGIVGTFLVITLPILGVGYLISEEMRMQGCEGRSAQDPGCKPSALWSFLETIGKNAATPTATTTAASTIPSIGKEGDVCGGSLYMPCEPGLSCLLGTDGKTGVCMPESKQVSRTGKPGDACGETIGYCNPGVTCKLSPKTTSGVCVEATPASPGIMRFSIHGAQFNGETFTAPAGTKVTINVQTQNTVSVSASMVAAVRIPLGDLKPGKDGLFTSTLTVPQGLSGSIEILATSKDGQVASMSVNVAAK